MEQLLARAIRKNWWLAGAVACALTLAGHVREGVFTGLLLLVWNSALMAVRAWHRRHAGGGASAPSRDGAEAPGSEGTGKRGR